MSNLLGEREQLTEKVKVLEQKVKDSEARERLRLELERELTQTREALLGEQKKGREHADNLKQVSILLIIIYK